MATIENTSGWYPTPFAITPPKINFVPAGHAACACPPPLGSFKVCDMSFGAEPVPQYAIAVSDALFVIPYRR